MSLVSDDIIIYETTNPNGIEKEGVRYGVFIDKYGILGKSFDLVTSCLDDNKENILIKIRIPGHVVIILWNINDNTMELFDPSAGEETMELIEEIMTIIFNGGVFLHNVLVFDDSLGYSPQKRYDLENDPLIIRVTNKNIQILPEDLYCQTWIYYYIYMRLVKGISYKEIIKYLEDIPVEKRLEMIEEFWNFLIKQ